MFKEGDIVQIIDRDETPYVVKLAMNDLNAYGLEYLSGILVVHGHELRQWTPINSIERWVSLNVERRWPHYKAWKSIAEQKGITVVELLDRHEGSRVMMDRM